MPARVQTHCVYVLRSLSSPGRSYVGYTSDPAHRLRQHNGEVAGGAKHTSRARPWAMQCVLSRFSTHAVALQFEWALQHPAASKTVRAAVSGRPGLQRAQSLRSKVAVARVMMGLAPWRGERLRLHFTSEAARDLWAATDALTAARSHPRARRRRPRLGGPARARADRVVPLSARAVARDDLSRP